MSEFWMSYDLIAQRYGPGYQGYPLFGAVLAVLYLPWGMRDRKRQS